MCGAQRPRRLGGWPHPSGISGRVRHSESEEEGGRPARQAETPLMRRQNGAQREDEAESRGGVWTSGRCSL